MKKILLLIAISVLFSVSSVAQFGVKAGMNFAKMSGVDIPGASQTSLNSFQAGVFMDKSIIPLLSLRLGLDYSPKGARLEANEQYIETSLNYLELPLLAKVKLGPMYGLGGFYGAYALNGKMKSNILVETEEDIDFENDNVSRWDYGMKFGLGFQLGLGPIHAFAQASYSFGFNNLNTSAGDEVKNSSVIGVSVGVLLGGK